MGDCAGGCRAVTRGGGTDASKVVRSCRPECGRPGRRRAESRSARRWFRPERHCAGRADRAERAGWITTAYATVPGVIAFALELLIPERLASVFSLDAAVVVTVVHGWPLKITGGSNPRSQGCTAYSSL